MTAIVIPASPGNTTLTAALERVKAALLRRLGRMEAEPVKTPRSPRRPAPRAGSDATAAVDPLALLVSRFSLTEFERDLVVLCAGMELDSAFAGLVAEVQRPAGGSGPTFGLALAALDGAHWSALTPAGALRRWRLLETAPGAGVTQALLRIDERVLHFLTGISYFEPRLQGLFEAIVTAAELSPSQVPSARALVEAWAGAGALDQKPVAMLVGDDPVSHETAAARAAGTLELGLFRVLAAQLPADAGERGDLARLWERESMLMRSAVLVVVGGDDPIDVQERARQFVEEVAGLVVISAPHRWELRRRNMRVLPLNRPGANDQLELWQRELGAAASRLNGAVERVATQFQLDAAAIRRAVAATLAAPRDEMDRALWLAGRHEARTSLEGLAQSIEPVATWSDLILPEAQLHVLRTIVAQVRQRARVTEQWGFGRRSSRGLGIHALFAGPSGTGKTLAAEVLARELELDLFRIDLSALVSKYIGETEKNLRRVFDAAERGGSILLFDEADALFGRRSEVRDSHDRYANIEVSYLLQRIESYRGLALLTSNLKAALDPAFSRRLRFTVHFPFPDQTLRAAIWRRIFPAETPLEGVDFDKLARLSLSGGHIRNLALNAAFLAADAGEPVGMRHLLAAAHAECAKLEKPLNPAEIADWT